MFCCVGFCSGLCLLAIFHSQAGRAWKQFKGPAWKKKPATQQVLNQQTNNKTQILGAEMRKDLLTHFITQQQARVESTAGFSSTLSTGTNPQSKKRLKTAVVTPWQCRDNFYRLSDQHLVQVPETPETSLVELALL